MNGVVDDGFDRGGSKDLRRLTPALKYLRPYGRQVIAASLALIVTAGATLSLGQGIRVVIDNGFASGQADVLVQSLSLFAGFVVLLTLGTFVRFYFVSWVGERVSADLRQAVFSHLIRIHPGFFELNAPSEIQSRITTDTTLLQTVIGSSVSIALRNVLMFFGGVVLLFITNAKLSLIVLTSVPFVVMPIVLFGRRVRSLSRSSQDRLADVGSYAGESLRHIKVVQSFNHQKKASALCHDRSAIRARKDLRRLTTSATVVSGEHFLNGLRAKVRQRDRTAANHVLVLVIDPECLQDCREQIARIHLTLHNCTTFRCRLSVRHSPANSMATQAAAPRAGKVVTAEAGVNRRSATELPKRNHKCVCQQPSVLKIIQQGRHAVVEVSTQFLMRFKVLAVAVPPCACNLHKRHTRFNKAACNKTLFTKLSRTILNTNRFRFVLNVEELFAGHQTTNSLIGRHMTLHYRVIAVLCKAASKQIS